MGDFVRTPVGHVSSSYPFFTIVSSLTISDDLDQKYHQLYKCQNIDNPCDLSFEPAFFFRRRTPPLPPRICISYKWIVLLVRENWGYGMSRVVLGLAAIQWNRISVIERVCLIVQSAICSRVRWKRCLVGRRVGVGAVVEGRLRR